MMKRLFKAVVAAFLLAVGLPSSVAAGPYEDADAAERRDDYATAIPIYRWLADKGHVGAQKRLGFFDEIGWGVKQDWLEAAKWYSNAVEAGDEDAGASLGFIGRNWRVLNRTKNMNPTIYELVENAANKGNAVAQFSLGVMNYPLGFDHPPLGNPWFDESEGNLHEALIWYRRAAEQGEVGSQVALGIAYARGIGVPQDYIEAHKWYNIAAPRSKYADIRTSIMERRDALALRMTIAQLAEAQRLAREWKPSSPH